jgi:hypothetical protein
MLEWETFALLTVILVTHEIAFWVLYAETRARCPMLIKFVIIIFHFSGRIVPLLAFTSSGAIYNSTYACLVAMLSYSAMGLLLPAFAFFQDASKDNSHLNKD